jgi:ABC-type lipoprotein release transport system permease subunit
VFKIIFLTGSMGTIGYTMLLLLSQAKQIVDYKQALIEIAVSDTQNADAIKRIALNSVMRTYGIFSGLSLFSEKR